MQEVAARVLEHDVPFESAEDLLPWARVVGRRLGVDWHRARARLADQQPPEDVPGRVDVAAAVEHRMALAATLAGLGQLSVKEREVLAVAPQPSGLERREQVRLAVRRHRVRARLAHLAEGLLSLPVLVRAWGWLRRHAEGVGVAAGASPVLVVALLPLLLGGPDPHIERSDRVEHGRVAVSQQLAPVLAFRAVSRVGARPVRVSSRVTPARPAPPVRHAGYRVQVATPAPVKSPYINLRPRESEDTHVLCVQFPPVLRKVCAG